MASFEKLTVYNRALEFAFRIYTLTHNWPKSEVYGITSQVRRASLSISLNIAEGSSRSNKEFVHFLAISRGSCYECIPILALSLKLNYLSLQEYQKLYTEVEELSKMINALRAYVSKK